MTMGNDDGKGKQQKAPIVEQARRPMSIEFSLRVEVDKDGNFELFGQPSFICPDHSTSIRLIQSCFLDQLSASIEGFATMPDEKLSEGARKLKRRILNTAWITYPPAPAPSSLDAAFERGVTFIVDKARTAEPPAPAPASERQHQGDS